MKTQHLIKYIEKQLENKWLNCKERKILEAILRRLEDEE